MLKNILLITYVKKIVLVHKITGEKSPSYLFSYNPKCLGYVFEMFLEECEIGGWGKPYWELGYFMFHYPFPSSFTQ